MTLVFLLSIPLVVAAVTLPLLFVGCEFQAGAIPGVSFDDAVTGVASLVSFWHLGEPSGPTAVDSTGGHDGTYNNAAVAEDLAHQSAGAPGTLEFDQPSLISSEPAKRSINVNGGYVEIPFVADLNTPQFTIMAFVRTGWTAADPAAYRCVIFAEQTETGGVHRGFSLYANPANAWEAFVGDGSGLNSVAADAAISLGTTDYLALTHDGTTLTLYVNGEIRGSAVVGFQPNTSHPLAIGQAIPGPFNPAYPFVGQLAEVAFYNTALDQQTIVNIGLASVGM